MTTQAIPKPSPTMYGGLLFRSRLEARYAALLDLCGNRWEYEPHEFGGYIPDFLLISPDGRETYLEIKPGRTVDELMPSMLKAREHGLYGPEILAVVGDGPRAIPLPSDGSDMSGLYWEDNEYTCGARLGICACGQLGWTSTEMSFHYRPCGHHDRTSGTLNDNKLHSLWRTAQNKTRWIGKHK